MRQNRRSYLQTTSALIAALCGAGTVAAADEIPVWDEETAYTGGDRVKHDGYIWKAKWWTKGTEPAQDESVWKRTGPVGDGGNGGGSEEPPKWNRESTYTEGDRVRHEGYIWEAKWWTRGDEPTTDANMWKQIREVEDGSGGNGSELTAVIDPEAPTTSVDESVTLSASDSKGDITTYEWNIDEKEQISGVDATVTFENAGDYSVSLTVTGSGGSTATDETTLTVESGSTQPTELTAETTIKDFLPTYEERYVPEIFLNYLPGEVDGGHGGGTVAWPDDQKASEFDVDIDAIRNNAGDGSLKFGSLGTQALDWATQFRSAGLPDHAIAQLLPRLMLLPDKTEEPTFQGKGRSTGWDETGGPLPASNDPSLFYQEEWPTDARSEKDEEVKERDRVYFQAKNDSNWSDDFSYLDNYDSALIETINNNTHPATGDPLGGDSFTANAQMEISTEIHGSDWFWYQALLFKNTSKLPYHLDGAVIWWLGPANFGKTMSAGSYNNEQRPRPGYGHPQRDIVEITLEEEHVPEKYADIDSTISAYAVRLAYHDSPYNMRTAYPDQYWSIEISVGEPLDEKFDTAEKRQRIVDMMAETAHVELETDMDRNDDVVDAIELYNRVGN